MIDDAREGIGISESDLASYRDAFEADPHSRMTQNALRQIDARSLSRKKLVVDHHFSHRLGMLKPMPLNQRESPRCWIFASQRMMQMYVMHIASHGSGGDYNRRENITDGAELSATYPLFWETYEKANAFYEEVIETAYPETHPMDEWQMREVFGDPLPRGGTWPLYQQLFLKYGAVPEKAMPETWASSKTDDMFELIKMMLREGGFELREAAQALVAKRARGGKKKPTVSSAYMTQMAALHADLLACSPHFIRCIKTNRASQPDAFDGAYVLMQLRCSGMMEALELMQLRRDLSTSRIALAEAQTAKEQAEHTLKQERAEANKPKGRRK